MVSTALAEYARYTPTFVQLHGLGISDRRRVVLRDQLVQGHLPIAHNVARRYINRGEPLDDLKQVAAVGLVKAVDRFDPFRGVPFYGFAIPTITGEVRRHFRDRCWAMAVPRALKDTQQLLRVAMSELAQTNGRAPTASELSAHLRMPREQVIEGLHAANSYRGETLDTVTSEHSAAVVDATSVIDSAMGLAENREVLAPLLAALPERERTILALRFFAEMTQSQIAERVGISQMHVSRLLARTLATLRDGMDADQLAL